MLLFILISLERVFKNFLFYLKSVNNLFYKILYWKSYKKSRGVALFTYPTY